MGQFSKILQLLIMHTAPHTDRDTQKLRSLPSVKFNTKTYAYAGFTYVCWITIGSQCPVDVKRPQTLKILKKNCNTGNVPV